jgi:hypothetical protein
MFTLFLFGTFWFWTLIAVTYISITIFSERGDPTVATIVMLGTAVLLQCFGKINIFPWILSHPKELILYLFGYLVFGVGYSLVKWMSFIRKDARETKERFIEYDNLNPKNIHVPRVEDYSSRIIGWMIYWPCNLVWTLLDDPIRALFEWIFERTKGLYQHIANQAYASVTKDIQNAKKITKP